MYKVCWDIYVLAPLIFLLMGTMIHCIWMGTMTQILSLFCWWAQWFTFSLNGHNDSDALAMGTMIQIHGRWAQWFRFKPSVPGSTSHLSTAQFMVVFVTCSRPCSTIMRVNVYNHVSTVQFSFLKECVYNNVIILIWSNYLFLFLKESVYNNIYVRHCLCKSVLSDSLGF